MKEDTLTFLSFPVDPAALCSHEGSDRTETELAKGEAGDEAHLMLLLCPVSGSTAWTRPTEQTGGQFSDTSRW